MTTLNTLIGFGAGSVAAVVLVWLLYWTVERAVESNTSLIPGLLLTIGVGAGFIAIGYQAGTEWIVWESSREAIQTEIATGLGVLVGGILGSLLLQPDPDTEPPNVPVRTEFDPRNPPAESGDGDDTVDLEAALEELEDDGSNGDDDEAAAQSALAGGD